MIPSMLVPLDGSDAAEAAMGYAALIPSEKVVLVHVVPESMPGAPDTAEAEAWAAAYLEKRAERVRRQGREVETRVLHGDPAEQILANAGDADLIVMTTRGLGSGERRLFGSVADRVARHAQAPTLLVRTEGPVDATPRVSRIVVPLDGSALSREALPVAVELASLLGVPVHLVHVMEADDVRASVQAGSRAAAAHARAQATQSQQMKDELEQQVRWLQSRDLAATCDVRAGQPATELLDLITPTDLVVMTTRGRGGARRWLLGSVADKLVHEAAAPVLLVRAGSAQEG